MPRWVHTLENYDWEELTADCAACGRVRLTLERRANGEDRYRCPRAHRGPRASQANKKRRVSRNAREAVETCPRCRAIIEDPCQLDGDHIVPRWRGGADMPENVQTLCANCHRLKSRLERLGTLPLDFMNAYPLTGRAKSVE